LHNRRLPKLLVTGAGGFLGWHVCAMARNHWQTWGVVRSHQIDIPGVIVVSADLTDHHAVRTLMRDIGPDAVIHCAALARPNDCELYPDQSRRINVDATAFLAGLCADARVPMIFTSTDLVFDGEHPPYAETSQPGPICVYGAHKLEAERLLLAQGLLMTVCRMPLMFGDPSPSAASFCTPMINALLSGTSVPVFADEVRTPVSATTAASGLLMAIGKQVPGIIHLGGREAVSRLEFGLKLATALGCDPGLLAVVHRKDIVMAAPRPRDVSLDSTRAFGLGYDPPGVSEELGRLPSVRAAAKKN
jgi:dTDP-4-dehydrorhamnose reductase